MADKYLYHSPDSPETVCIICGNGLRTRWTDTHGIGACVNCGCPYRLFHYEDNKAVDKPETKKRRYYYWGFYFNKLLILM